MKPVPIADYLEQIGRPASEASPSRRDTSPFRPRSLHAPPPAEALPAAQARFPAWLRTPAEERAQRPAFDRWAPLPSAASPREPLAARENAKDEDTALLLAEAHARGREEGRAEARAEAEERRAADRATAREQALLEHIEFQLNGYAQLETAIRIGFVKVEENVGAAVGRLLAPFLAKQAVKYVVDELSKAIRRLCAGGPPGLITIRGPERILTLLRERIADLPAQIDYVEDRGAEAVVEAGATHIVTELRAWAELLASLDV